MKNHSRFVEKCLRAAVAVLSLSLLVIPLGPAWARGGGGHGGGHSEFESHGSGGKHGGEGIERHGGRHGSIVRELPNGYREISRRGERYFFNDGRFYNSHRDGFIIVGGPIGIRVPILPVGALRVELGGLNYHVVDDNYYRPTDNGYVVVDAPQR